MLSGAAARRINVNTDGRSLPTMSTTAFVLTLFFAQTPPFCVSLSSFRLSPI